VTTALFRRTAEGWVFRATNLSGLGPQPHFLVNDAQKSRIELACGIVSLATFAALALPVAWLASYSFLPLRTRSDWDNHFLIFVALSLLLVFAHRVARIFALRPILKDAPRSSARITLRERLQPVAARQTFTSLLLMFLLFVAMLLFSVGQALTARTQRIANVTVVTMGALTFFYGALIWVKRRVGR
jgi:hypothetical protein